MAYVTKCDNCSKEAKQPAAWIGVQEFGVISTNQPPLFGPYHFCSYQCLATWAQAHVSADKDKTYRIVGKS